MNNKKKRLLNKNLFFLFFIILYPERDLNPHALMDTWPSTMPVYQFQHPGLKNYEIVIWLGLPSISLRFIQDMLLAQH